MSIIQYTRQQLLSIFDKSLPLPEGTNRIPGIIQDEPSIPASFQKSQTAKYRSNNPDQKRVKADIDIKKVMKAKSQNAAPPKIVSEPVTTQIAWFYLDLSGMVHGPFQSSRLRDWWVKNLIPHDLKISPNGKEFKEAKDFFSDLSLAFTYNPLLFPFLGNVTVDEDDQLQNLFLEFEKSFSQQ